MPWIALVGPEFEENLSLRYLASSLAAAGFPSDPHQKHDGPQGDEF
jgi:hypothetical protein